MRLTALLSSRRGKSPRRALFAVLALLLVVGCGGTGAAPPTAPRAADPAPPVAAVSAPTAAPAAPASAAAAPTKLTVAVGALSTNYVPLFVTKEQGFFDKYGIDAELTYMDGSATERAVATGDSPIGGTGAGLIPSRLAGADIVMIAAIASRLASSLYVQPDVTSVEALRGRTLATTTPGSSNYQTVQVYLRRIGLEFGQDVQVVNAGGANEQLAMLGQGLADAAFFTPPASLRARDLGLRELVALADANIPFATASIGANRAYAERNPEVVKNFLRAYGEGLRVAQTEPTVAKAALAKYARIEDPAILDESYAYVVPIWPRGAPYPSLEAIQTLLDLQDAPAARTARAEDFAEPRYLRELEEAGFFRQLAAQ